MRHSPYMLPFTPRDANMHSAICDKTAFITVLRLSDFFSRCIRKKRLAVAEEPRDALYQMESCQVLQNTTCNRIFKKLSRWN